MVGLTEVYLESPGEEESNLGDVLTDSMVEWWTNQGKDVEFALLNNGGIRASIEIGKRLHRVM